MDCDKELRCRGSRKRKQDVVREKRAGILEQLKKARESGTVARDLSDIVEPLYDEVDADDMSSTHLFDFDDVLKYEKSVDNHGCSEGKANIRNNSFKETNKMYGKSVVSSARDIRSMLCTSLPQKSYKLDEDPLLDELLNDLRSGSDCRTLNPSASPLINNLNDYESFEVKATTTCNDGDADFADTLVDTKDVITSSAEIDDATQLASLIDDLHADDWNDTSFNLNRDSAKHQQHSLCSDEADSMSISADALLSKNHSNSIISEFINMDENFEFYWIDAFEDRSNPTVGVLYFFGKIIKRSDPKCTEYTSCCVFVENIERKITIIPRQNLTDSHQQSVDAMMLGVRKEIDQVFETRKILKYRCKVKEIKNCFYQDIPNWLTVLEVYYPAIYPELPANLSGDTFQSIIGTSNSLLETFLLERKIKGPCWLQCKNIGRPQVTKSWCCNEINVNSTDVSILPNDDDKQLPSLCAMILSCGIVPSRKGNQNEIISLSIIVDRHFTLDQAVASPDTEENFTVITKRDDLQFPLNMKLRKDAYKRLRLTTVPSERTLLSFLLNRIHIIDPDIIIGHDISRSTIETLLIRIDQTRTQFWSKLGRLRRSVFPKSTANCARYATTGRLVIDIGVCARELLPKCRRFDLPELCSHVLNVNKVCIAPDDLVKSFGDADTLFEALSSINMDNRLVLQIAISLHILPLAYQLTKLCGNLLSRTLSGGRSDRNEYLLLNAFYQSGYLLPEPTKIKSSGVESKESTNEGGKTQYAGGLVLEPKIGFYDKFILLLDFNSLYPSIIQEYNICFTTVNHFSNAELEISNATGNGSRGILPTEIQKLVSRRKQIKSMMNDQSVDQDKLRQYDIRQMALKLTANSMYGCLGFRNSRFYAEPIAALITRLGRETLMNSKLLVESLHCEVIYGDTDSIMINSCLPDIDEAIKLANKLKSRINERYSCLEIDLDAVFKTLLLLKKKKYAALVVDRVNPDKTYVVSKQLKGLDIVRRDWCPLAKDIGESVVDLILTNTSDNVISFIHSMLIELKEKVESNGVDVLKFVIDKQLTKQPCLYADNKSLPHVQVALRMNERSANNAKPGDIISYVICKDGTDRTSAQRGYSLHELENDSKLEIDIKYYLSSQVHPIVTRLLEPFPDTDAARIAECLGIDFNQYKTKSTDNPAVNQFNFTKDSSKCDGFEYACYKCKTTQIWTDSVFVFENNRIKCILNEGCKQCLARPIDSIHFLCNIMVLTIRKYIKRYYEGWNRCDDMTCNSRSQQYVFNIETNSIQCPICLKGNLLPEYSSHELYEQLCYFRDMFDLKKLQSRIVSSSVVTVKDHLQNEVFAEAESADHALLDLRELVTNQYIRRDAHGFVDLTMLFGGGIDHTHQQYLSHFQ
ncbi:hypothetical protein GJ496_007939 [Pomphorhynchus laevis]|nr:hypothetical protein GJ496_007939 [Pomphorhynchus laevis]